MEVKRVQPYFGMAVVKDPRTPAISAYLNKMNKSTYNKLHKIIEEAQNEKLNVYIGADKNKKGEYKFYAEAGGIKYYENIIRGPIGAVKKALKRVRKMEQEQNRVGTQWNGSYYTHPKLK